MRTRSTVTFEPDAEKGAGGPGDPVQSEFASLPSGKSSWWLLLAAALWSVGLIVAALTVPAYESLTANTGSGTTGSSGQLHEAVQSSRTLVAENGPKVLILVGIPLVVVALIALALWLRRRTGKQGVSVVAWLLAGLLLALALLSALTIGPFVLPAGAMVIAACSLA
jgi:hypothetical protein